MNLISFYDNLAETDFYRQLVDLPLDRSRLHLLTVGAELWPFSCPVGALTSGFTVTPVWLSLDNPGVEYDLSGLDIKRVSVPDSGKFVMMYAAEAVELPAGLGYIRLAVADFGVSTFYRYSDVMCVDTDATVGPPNLIDGGGTNTAAVGAANVIYSGTNEV